MTQEGRTSKSAKTKRKKAAPAPETAAKPAAPAINGAADGKSLIEDFDALSDYVTDVSGKSQEVIREFFVKHTEQPVKVATGQQSVDPLNVGEAFKEMMRALAADPGTVMQRQFNLWGDYAKIMATMAGASRRRGSRARDRARS